MQTTKADVTKFLERATLTVAELIEKLQRLPADGRVLFACDYGDHCRTEQALGIKTIDEIPAARLECSGYSHSGYAVRDEDEDDSYEDDSDEQTDYT